MARPERLDGIMLLDKPMGLTSHDAVAQVRRLTGQRQIGHTGTLDPLATGLLVLCLGKATKVTQFLAESDKTYDATIRLGIRSSTFDAEGVPAEAVPNGAPDAADASFREVLKSFVGRQNQVVPPHASVRIQGRHMYDLTRRGAEFERPSKEITIKAIGFGSYVPPDLRISVTCSKGTYIRSLASDIGDRFGCGGYLADLRRTRVGKFSLDEALSVDEVGPLVESGELAGHLVPIEQALQFSSILLAESGAETVVHGRSPRWQDVVRVDGAFQSGDTVLLKNALGSALAVAIAGVDSRIEHAPKGKPIQSFVRVLA